VTDRARSADLEHLAALHRRDVRDSTGKFLIEGVRFVARARGAGAVVSMIAVSRELLRNRTARALVRAYRDEGVTIAELTRAELESISILDEPQGIAAVVDQRWGELPPPRRARGGLWLGLHRLRSPGNLGTMIRTASAAGARGVILLDGAIDPFDPRALRPSMGAAFAIEMIRCRVPELERWAGRSGARIIGATAQTRADYRDRSYRGPTVLMLGHERSGLSDEQRALCHQLVRIPMRGGVDSLNIAAAAAVLLYQAFDQRQPLRQRRRRLHSRS
jgi:TrmH family RNA methyltransferase